MINSVKTEEKYEAVIGLETHLELETATKMFCGCRLSFGEEKNVNTCPVCLGHPGSLPVINKKAVDFAIKIALALNCRINKKTIFHRKNYFYPDMPKNYQISQYDIPLGVEGHLEINMGEYVRRVGITRVHMEEDAGKLIHTGATGRISGSGSSIVDFNRAGTPLIEIVTEPDIRTPEEARQYMTDLRNLLLYLDVSNCSMEEGSLRCDANASIRPAGGSGLGIKTEIKNLNSFKFLQKGLEYEIKRQKKLLDSGKQVIQQTRHYDNESGVTKALRSKEEAHDYRYFPEPDLVPIIIDESMVEGYKGNHSGTSPEKKPKDTLKNMDCLSYDADFMAGDRRTADYFERCLECFDDAKAVANWIMGDFSALANKKKIHMAESKVQPGELCRMLEMIASGRISTKIAKTVFEEMFEKGSSPEEIIKEKGLEQISDSGELESIIDEVISSNPGPVQQYREGTKKAIGFLIGQVMARTGGKANPGLVNDIMSKKLG